MARVKISELRAKLLEADQCAARALEGRDKMIAECLRLEEELRRGPRVVATPIPKSYIEAKERLPIVILERRILQTECELLRLRLKRAQKRAS